MMFGNVVHAVLEAFGQGESRDSEDSDEILGALMLELDNVLTGDFANPRMPAVKIQVQQLQRRLEVFATKQAAWAADGWRILATEAESNKIVLDTGANAVWLRGKIDRVDRHQSTGEYAILDYKSGQNAKQLKDVRKKDGTWLDLQLPLYRFIGNQRGWEDAKVGYINLPGKAADTQFVIADWNESIFQSAIDEAKRIVDAIAEQRFWPPGKPKYDDDFSRLLMRGIPEKPDFGEG